MPANHRILRIKEQATPLNVQREGSSTRLRFEILRIIHDGLKPILEWGIGNHVEKLLPQIMEDIKQPDGLFNAQVDVIIEKSARQFIEQVNSTKTPKQIIEAQNVLLRWKLNQAVPPT